MEHPDSFEAVVIMIAGVGMIFAVALIIVTLFSRPVPNDASLWGEAHFRAMQAEARAMKGERP